MSWSNLPVQLYSPLYISLPSPSLFAELRASFFYCLLCSLSNHNDILVQGCSCLEPMDLTMSLVCVSLLKCHALGVILFFYFCVLDLLSVCLHGRQEPLRVWKSGLVHFTTVFSLPTTVPDTQELLRTCLLREQRDE